MPRIPTKKPNLEEVQSMASWEAFENSTDWKRSKRGNLWRHWEGMTVTIYSRDDDYFSWCIADGEKPLFSQGAFESEDDAIESAGFALGIGE